MRGQVFRRLAYGGQIAADERSLDLCDALPVLVHVFGEVAVALVRRCGAGGGADEGGGEESEKFSRFHFKESPWLAVIRKTRFCVKVP